MSDRVAQVAAHLNYPRGLLAGQVAIVTGSGQGIGAETARLFANEGARASSSPTWTPVSAVSLRLHIRADSPDKCAAVADSINRAGGQALSVPGDVTEAAYVDALVSRAAAFGGGKIHILVNNAGYTWDAVVHRMTDQQWEAMVAVHCTAPFRLIRAAAPFFRVRDGDARCIVNVSSTSGVYGNPGQANYALAKAGVTGLTKTVAKEWGPAFGVRCNAVAFGFVETRLTAAKEEGAFVTGPGGERISLGIPQAQRDARKGGQGGDYPDIPLRRLATATEAARSILAVASPLFSYVPGQTIMVTGGRNM